LNNPTITLHLKGNAMKKMQKKAFQSLGKNHLLLSAVCGVCLSFSASLSAFAEAADKPATATATTSASAMLSGFEPIGDGLITAYRKGNQVLLAVPANAIKQPFIWYAEVVSAPAELVANDGLEVANMVAQFERHQNIMVLRDITGKSVVHAGDTPEHSKYKPDTGISSSFNKAAPIDQAINQTKTGPAMAALPILAEKPDGTVLIDVTKLFSSEIAGASPRRFIGTLGVNPAALDPQLSYIDKVRAFSTSLNIRSHLTYLNAVPSNPTFGPVPMSIVVGHSFLFLPKQGMTPREYDPRIGFFTVDQLEFEAKSGAALEKRSLITKFKLEKANPNQAVSDPVKPIVFYIGRGVPDRWKPYLKAGVEQWKPVFEAAGFSNAIMAIDAPSPKDDPNWSAEDVGINVIRWLPQDRVNAMGPHAVDPRTGEALSAHIQIWPSVIDGFGKYYYGLYHTVDPEANTLPLSEKRLGEILQYAVAHEVGHTLGLRHNQIASTAYSIKQLRDPVFTNTRGPNSSIMAYGRFNQAAQPGDGVSKFIPGIGPYDYAAIKWAYGDFSQDPAALQKLANTFTQERELYWGATEGGAEWDKFGMDPRIQTENVGAERIDATKLGVANYLRTLSTLESASGNNNTLFTETYTTMMSSQTKLINSVLSLLGGTMPRIGSPAGEVDLVPAAEQSRAVAYYLGEGARSLDAYRKPSMLHRISAVGAEQKINQVQSNMLAEILVGRTFAVLDAQATQSPKNYTTAALGRDVANAVWGNLASASASSRALQLGYIAQSKKLIESWANGGAGETAQAQAYVKLGLPVNAATLIAETGDNTTYPAWLRGYLPSLQSRLNKAAKSAQSEGDRLHFAEMATQVSRLTDLAKGLKK
jgi:Met-zincin/Domain of unknown function (DUF5117)